MANWPFVVCRSLNQAGKAIEGMLYTPCGHYGKRVSTMRSDNEILRYQKTLTQYRDQAKATIAITQSNSEEFNEAIKVFLRCDGAIEAMNWVLGLPTGDFSVTPAGAQRRKG